MNKHDAVAPRPTLIDRPNLSAAWAEAFVHIVDHPGKELAPLVLSVTGFAADGLPVEDVEVRQKLDTRLQAKDKLSIEDVAYTIFPQRLWKIAKGDRKRLFELYAMAFPRYRAMNRQLNGRGLYFERLMSFGDG